MIWVECLSLQKSLQDLDYLLKTSITDKSLMSILYTYALFDLRQQRINRELKKIEKSHPKSI